MDLSKQYWGHHTTLMFASLYNPRFRHTISLWHTRAGRPLWSRSFVDSLQAVTGRLLLRRPQQPICASSARMGN